MEHLEIFCEQTNEATGEVLPRAEALAKQAWCRSTNVFIVNHQGQVLCHRRTMNKERMPGWWMTHVGGHVGVGETYESNAQKELQEEAGVCVEADQLISWRTTKLEKARLWVREFVVVIDQSAETFIPQPGEVECFAWYSPEEILRLSKEEGNWAAGTHDFLTEYHCLRAVIAAVQARGIVQLPEASHVWHHLPMPA